MRDPRVVTLTYDLQTPSGLVYDAPPAIDVSRDEFSGRLFEGRFIATMRKDYATQEEARVPVDRFLQGWVVDALLSRSHEIEFVFRNSEIIDRMPYSNGHVLHVRSALVGVTCAASATLTLRSQTYPSPPERFSQTPLVERMLARLKQYRSGREPLYPVAYYCLTDLGDACAGNGQRGSRRAIATRFGIDLDVLNTIGELSSERGGSLEARKAGKQPASPAEAAWLESALRKMIRQVGLVEAGDTSSKLTMEHLPPL